MSNPAKRAFEILSRLDPKKVQIDKNAMVDIWGQAFRDAGCPTENVYENLRRLYTELEEAEEAAIDQFGPEKARVKLKYFNELKCAVGLTREKYLPSEAGVHSLESLAIDLHEEPEISATNLDGIQREVTELLEHVKKSSLKPQLKRWIMGWLGKILAAIIHYNLNGAKGLQDALIAIQGEACFLTLALKEVENEDPTFYAKFEEFFTRATKVAAFAERVKKLCDSSMIAPLISLGLKKLGLTE
jgi:hypothetical protein